MDQRLAPALRELQRLLTQTASQLQITLRFALLGGLAVSTWGVIRATQDIDFLADCDPSPLKDLALRDSFKKILEEQNSSAEWRVGDYDDPILLLLRIELSPTFQSVGADILWAHKRWQRDALARSITVKLSRQQVRVLHPEDLILLKLDAGGPQDLTDVAGLLADPPPQLDLHRLKEAAARLRLRKVLEKCLRDVRG